MWVDAVRGWKSIIRSCLLICILYTYTMLWINYCGYIQTIQTTAKERSMSCTHLPELSRRSLPSFSYLTNLCVLGSSSSDSGSDSASMSGVSSITFSSAYVHKMKRKNWGSGQLKQHVLHKHCIVLKLNSSLRTTPYSHSKLLGEKIIIICSWITEQIRD
jgi:hypothetical protein